MSSDVVNRLGLSGLLLVFLALAIAILANIANNSTSAMAQQQVPQGDPRQAPLAIQKYGCGSCHVIPGIAGADGMVGPKLTGISERSFLAGELPNTPDNLIMWIQHPQKVKPGTAMPELGVSDADARNIAAYLYSMH